MSEHTISPEREEPSRSGAAAATRGASVGRLRWIAGGALLAAAYWTVVRPRLLNWGATATEVGRPLPGDVRLPDPDGESTMAITIDAPPAAVWPWLRQLGQEQGGFYSYEWAENLVGFDIHNADEIVPEYQSLAVGDTVLERVPDARRPTGRPAGAGR